MQKINITPATALMALAAQVKAEQIPSAQPVGIITNHGGNIKAPAVAGVSAGFVAEFLTEEFLLDEFTATSIASTTDSFGDAVAMAFVVAKELAPQHIADLDDVVEPRTPEARLYQAMMFAARALPDFTVEELNLRFAHFSVDVFGAGPGAWISLADAVRTGEVAPDSAWRVLTHEQNPPLILA